MEEQRKKAYTALTKKLLAASSQQEQIQILQQHHDLVDDGLIKMIRLIAADFDEQESNSAKWLRNLAQYLTLYIESTQPTKADFKFLLEILKIIDDEEEKEQIYELLRQNQDKLNSRLANALRIWADNTLATLETEQKSALGYVIGNFSIYLQEFPLGNRADNIDIVITCARTILNIFTQTDFPQDWAGTQNNLGIAYSTRIKGERAENIENAIFAYQQALIVRTQKDFPYEWAATQNNLGLAYSTRIKGERAKNIENAIFAYQQALIVRTQKDFPYEWAATQNNLGIAYGTRIKGERAENIENAIFACQQALTIYTQKDFPQNWAKSQVILGIAYSTRIKGERGENIENAISACQQALTIYTQQDFPYEWATTQNNLGITYRERIKGKRAENIENAISAYQQALTIYTQQDFPQDWAGTQNNLSITYRERIKGERAENIENAIFACQQALIVRTQKDFPYEWAATQNNLGITYRERIKGKRAENIENAIFACQQALIIYTQRNFPQEWAATQNNLSIAYGTRIKGERAENIENAIFACQQALIVRTQKDFPYEWANNQVNLGLAYSTRIKGERGENIENAISAYQQALTIYTQQDFPYEWAMTQNNLGITYRERIKGKRGENIENAIFAYQQALIIRTQTDFPQNWAATQNNLAAAYSTSIKGERAENIENAIFACQQALIIRTQTDFPQDWAETQNNLAAAYSIRIKGERAENIENAICAYQQALIIRTQKDFPVDCLLTANNLGTLHFNEGNWKSAIEAYITAIEAIEQSREWASNDYNKQEIISNAISVYQNIVQACINSGELDKALEFVERGKARNLVDLLATRDLYPKGDIPQKIIDQLDDLRQKVIAEEKRLKQQSNYKGGLDTNTSTEGNRDVAAAKASQNAALDRTHLNNLYHELEQLVTDKIQKIDPGFQLTQRVKPIEFEQIQATLPNQQTALIEWFISQKNFSVFIVTTQQAKPLHIAYSNEDYQQVFSYFDLYLFNYSIYKYLNQKWINLRSLCKQFYTPFNLQQFIASTEIFKFLLITCYQLLLNKNLWKNSLSDLFSQIAQNLQLETITEQIKQTLPDCNQVIIVPHRWLHLLPIHAIPLSNGKCLLDLFSNGVSYAPSVQLLELTQKQARKKKGNREDENFFAVQNPTQDLEFTEIEVQAIRKQFSPQDDVLEGIQAHKQALTKDRLSKANLSHFSCHGSFNFENPELSALHLASSKIEEKTKQDLVATVEKTRFLPDRDGSFIDLEQCLTLGEIFGLDLRNCRLVTLSACETGLTDFKSLSDEYIGLPSGFLFAGSPSVVSSLWAVNDLSTSLLMIKFYQNLEEINSVPIALNQAQLWLRSVTKEELYQFANNLSIPKYQIIPYLDADLKELPADTIPFASPYYWAAFCAIGS